MNRVLSYRVTFTVAVIAILLGSFAFAILIPGPQARAAGTFVVNGSKIIDPDGKEFVIKGTNINGPNWYWPRDMTLDADLIAQVWKFNFVRVMSNVNVHNGSWSDNNDTDKLVEAFTSRKVVVMFAPHDWTGSVPSGQGLTDLKNWFTDLATRYKDNPYVWFDTYNEPFGCSSDLSKWLTVQQDLISTIRGTGANNIISVEGVLWGADGATANGCYDQVGMVAEEKSAILTHGPALTQQFSNIAFQVHMYCWGTDAKMNNFLDRVAGKNLALFVGEYGIVGGGQCNGQLSTQALFRVLPAHNIGRVVWSWFGGDNNTLVHSPKGAGGYFIDRVDGNRPTNLTQLGAAVWADNHDTLYQPTSRNSVGISYDGSLGAGTNYANLDNSGNSYSTEALQATGLVPGQQVVFNGQTYNWPQISAPTTIEQPHNAPLADNFRDGQIIQVEPTSATTLSFLGAATGGQASGTGTITYTDESTQNFTLTVSDWTLNGGSVTPDPSNTIVATMPYRNGYSSRVNGSTYVFSVSVALQEGKTVKTIKLPTAGNGDFFAKGQFHLFALNLPTVEPAPPVVSPVVSKIPFVDRASWTPEASTTIYSGKPRNALDGDPTTRWDSGQSQINGLYYQVDLGFRHTFNRVVLDTSASPHDYPRGYMVSVSNDGITWSAPIARGHSRNASVLTITFAPQHARYFRIVETQRAHHHWSIHELNVY